MLAQPRFGIRAGLAGCHPRNDHPVRAGRRTNLALLGLVVLAFVTGTASYGVGTASATTLLTTAHATAGAAIVLLVPWKSVIARRGLGRPPHPGRSAGLVLAVLLAGCVAAGVAQEVVGYRPVLGLAPLQVHVGLAVLVVPLLTAHVATHRQRPRAADLSRRTVLATGGLTAGALAATWLSRAVGPSLAQQPTGSSERGSHEPARMPVTQWFTDTVPPPERRVVPLRVDGVAVDLPDARDEVEALLDCTGGWYAVQLWGGVRLDRLLGPLPPDARSVDVVSVTGYRRRFPVEAARDLLLATTVAGRPLSAGHGGPRRLVAPGRRGFHWVKWVAAVEVVHEPPWLQPPFPLR